MANGEWPRRPEYPEKERARWALWPGPVLPSPDGRSALVFYGKLKCGVGAFNFHGVGQSLAVWDAPDQTPLNKDEWDYCGLGHAEFMREGGRVEYVTYYRPTEFLKGEMRLVEARLR
ncbi:MAG: hypothetical protein HY719_09385 [Planctomycetes bacterium]|nr:hypothetical protein [Planctomycetota bacterium]